MSATLFYAAVGSQILPLARTTSPKEKFQKLITNLLTRCHRQGCQNAYLKCLLNKLFCKHFETFKRFADTTNSFI